MTKNVKKKGRVWHLPDSCLYTSLEQKEPSEKMKYKELSANTGSDYRFWKDYLFLNLILIKSYFFNIWNDN